MQINAQVMNHTYFNPLKGVRPWGFYLPVMWADEQGTITDDLADQFKSEVSRE